MRRLGDCGAGRGWRGVGQLRGADASSAVVVVCVRRGANALPASDGWNILPSLLLPRGPVSADVSGTGVCLQRALQPGVRRSAGAWASAAGRGQEGGGRGRGTSASAGDCSSRVAAGGAGARRENLPVLAVRVRHAADLRDGAASRGASDGTALPSARLRQLQLQLQGAAEQTACGAAGADAAAERRRVDRLGHAPHTREPRPALGRARHLHGADR